MYQRGPKRDLIDETFQQCYLSGRSRASHQKISKDFGYPHCDQADARCSDQHKRTPNYRLSIARKAINILSEGNNIALPGVRDQTHLIPKKTKETKLFEVEMLQEDSALNE